MLSFKNLLRILINTGIGVILVLVWLRFINLEELIRVLKTVKIEYALLFFVFFIAASCCRALRLKLLLSEFKIPYFKVLPLHFLGQFLSFMIPLRLGELTRSVYLSTQYNLPMGKSVVWILIDRFLDFWVHFLLIGILVLVLPISLYSGLNLVVYSLLVLFAVATFLVLVLPRFTRRLVEIISFVFIFRKAQNIFRKTAYTIIEGFEILDRHPLELLFLLILTVGAILSDALIWYFVLLSFGINLGFLTTWLGSMINTLTFIIPAAPGFVGSAEAAGLAVFSGILGIDPTTASAATVLSHVLSFIALPLFGILGLYFLDFDLKLVWRKFKKE